MKIIHFRASVLHLQRHRCRCKQMLLDVKFSAVKTGELEGGGRLSGGVGRRRPSPGGPPRCRAVLAFALSSNCFSSAAKKRNSQWVRKLLPPPSNHVGQCQGMFNLRRKGGGASIRAQTAEGEGSAAAGDTTMFVFVCVCEFVHGCLGDVRQQLLFALPRRRSVQIRFFRQDKMSADVRPAAACQ